MPSEKEQSNRREHRLCRNFWQWELLYLLDSAFLQMLHKRPIRKCKRLLFVVVSIFEWASKTILIITFARTRPWMRWRKCQIYQWSAGTKFSCWNTSKLLWERCRIRPKYKQWFSVNYKVFITNLEASQYPKRSFGSLVDELSFAVDSTRCYKKASLGLNEGVKRGHAIGRVCFVNSCFSVAFDV